MKIRENLFGSSRNIVEAESRMCLHWTAEGRPLWLNVYFHKIPRGTISVHRGILWNGHPARDADTKMVKLQGIPRGMPISLAPDFNPGVTDTQAIPIPEGSNDAPARTISCGPVGTPLGMGYQTPD
jgi:hypothetical protein